MNHVMLDLETMGFRGNAAIVSIGAVAFDPDQNSLGEKFYINVELSSCLEYGLSVDGATVAWWITQNNDAKESLFKDTEPLDKALEAFANYIQQFEKVKVWGNGLGFDNVIMKNAYAAIKQERPWSDFQDRDMRTIVDIAESIHGKQKRVKKGIAHNALDDAINQAETVCSLWNILKKNHNSN
jgi:oligoribonuclease (3'-5' exoribonuclease)